MFLRLSRQALIPSFTDFPMCLSRHIAGSIRDEATKLAKTIINLSPGKFKSLFVMKLHRICLKSELHYQFVGLIAIVFRGDMILFAADNHYGTHAG